MTGQNAFAPSAVLSYGVMGVMPFWLVVLAKLLAPATAGASAAIKVIYAALILSFLGGARWGMEIRNAKPKPVVVGLAMIPSLAGLAVVVFLHGAARLQLFALAALLTVIWGWDSTAKGLPDWYTRLRSGLTLGAVAGLCAAAGLVPQ